MFGFRTKKIYIDSRFRTNTSRSNSDFDFELNETLDMPEKCIAYIDDIALPVTWYNCDSTNNKLYIRKIINGTNAGDVIVTLTEGQYNADQFATEIQTQLRASIASTFVCTYSALKGTLTIKPNAVNYKFKILTDQDIKTKLNNNWSGSSYDVLNPSSFNETLRNTEGTSLTYDDSTPYVSGFIDILAGKHYLYLTSSNLGSYTSLGARGERNIVKKIMVTQNYGYNCIESASFSGDDYIDVSKQSLRTLSFKLTDAFGNIVNLNGSNFSFSVVFSILDKDV
jgi:hypothetical protein